MNVLSLFDGMSCARIALEKLGLNCDYFSSEIDKNSLKVSGYNYPSIIQMGDICELKSSHIPRIDLLIGGSPCQSFSPAISSNTGFDGKSKLFFEYARLLKDVKPEYFILENVVMKKKWEDVISDLLGVKPIMINSADFSAQSRPRLYWTNIPQKPIQETNKDLLKDILLDESEVDEKYYYSQSFEFHGFDKVVCATLDINGHDILKRVNSPYKKCQTLTAVCGGNQQKKVLDNAGRVRKLTPLEYERLQTVPDNYTSVVSDGARYKMLGNGFTVDVISYLLGALK